MNVQSGVSLGGIAIVLIVLMAAVVGVIVAVGIAFARGHRGRGIVGLLVATMMALLLVPGLLMLMYLGTSSVPQPAHPAMNAGMEPMVLLDHGPLPNGDIHWVQQETPAEMAGKFMMVPMLLAGGILVAVGMAIFWACGGQAPRAMNVAKVIALVLIVGAVVMGFRFSRVESVRSHAARQMMAKQQDMAIELQRQELQHGERGQIDVQHPDAPPAPAPPDAAGPLRAAADVVSPPVAVPADAAAVEATAPPKPVVVEVVPDDTAKPVLPAGASLTTVPRPAWVDARPIRKQGSYAFVLSVGPYKTREECNRELGQELQIALQSYANTYVKANTGDRVTMDPMALEAVAVREYHEDIINSSFGPMLQLYANCEFTEEFRQRLVQQDNAVLHEQRMINLAVGCALVLGMISILFGYLKLDTATRGYYSRRLQVATALAILSLGAAGVVTYKQLLQHSVNRMPAVSMSMQQVWQRAGSVPVENSWSLHADQTGLKLVKQGPKC